MAVRLLDELSDLEKLALIDISYSRLDTYGGELGCQAKYFYSYIIKEPRIFGAAATLGNIVHSTLEEKLDEDSELQIDVLMDEFEKQKVQWDPEEKIPAELISAGKVMLEEFVDRHDGEKFHIYQKELEFRIVVGTASIHGFIDRVDIEGDIVRITDYKTGKYEVAAKNVPNNLQLGIYALAANKLFPGKQIYASLYYLRSGKQKGHLFTESDLEAVEIRLRKLIYDLIHKSDFATTSNEWNCKFCDHATSGACPTGARRTARYR